MKFFRSAMVTVQNRTFMEFWDHDPFVWVPESKEETVHYVNWNIGKYPVLGLTTCNKAFHSKESWVVVSGALKEQNIVEVRVMVDWILHLSFRPKDWSDLRIGSMRFFWPCTQRTNLIFHIICQHCPQISPSSACHANALLSAYSYH